MRIKPTLNLGIAALALSASVFLGCQDFLSEDKAGPTAKAPSEENTLVAAQEAASYDSAQLLQGKAAGIEIAEDMPAKADVTPEPAKDMPAKADVIPEPATTPAVPDNAAECKETYAQMQTALQSSKDLLYMELKTKFGGLNCDITKFSTPFVPPDSATVCKNLRATLATLDPSSPKYPGYQQDIATYCADAKVPAAPALPSAPAASDNAAECKEILTQMQTAKDPLYGELKNKFSELKCDFSQGPSVPPTPPDSATVCKNFKTSLDQMDPSSSKYPLYLEQIAIYCTTNP